MKWASWVNFGLGLWLFFAPIIFGYTSVKAALCEDVVLGGLIAGLALWRALGPGTPGMAYGRWGVAIAGFWAMLAPFELGYGTTRAPVNNDVIVGLVVLILGIWRAVSVPRAGGTLHPHMVARH